MILIKKPRIRRFNPVGIQRGIKSVAVFITLLSWNIFTFGQDASTIEVHFLHGSKPLKNAENAGPKWFGGIHGGHVGLKFPDETILHFVPSGELHIFGRRNKPHGRFAHDNTTRFYNIFPTENDSLQTTVVVIPVEPIQMDQLRKISEQYTSKSPYDYAFFGMRCSAASWDMLAQSGVVKKYPHGLTWTRFFYPKLQRKKLLRMAEENNWNIRTTTGSSLRRWEK